MRSYLLLRDGSDASNTFFLERPCEEIYAHTTIFFSYLQDRLGFILQDIDYFYLQDIGGFFQDNCKKLR